MKAIKDLLNRRSVRGNTEIDDKTTESIFFNVLMKQSGSITRADIKEIRFKGKSVFIKTRHPAVASEIWRRKEGLIREVNKLSETEAIGNIRVK